MCRYRSFRWVPQIPATLQAILSYRYLHFVIPPRYPHVFSGRSRSRVTVTIIVTRRFMRTALINFFNKPKSEIELTQKDQRYGRDFVAQFSRLFLKTPTPSLSLSLFDFRVNRNTKQKNCCTLNWCLLNVQSMNTHDAVLNIAVFYFFLCFFVLGWHVRFQLVRHSVRRYLASFHWILWSSGHWLGSWWVRRLTDQYGRWP